MEKKFFTAQEANKKAKGYSGINIICRRIEEDAGGGCFKTSFLNILPQDKTKLEMLGFTVLVILMINFLIQCHGSDIWQLFLT